MVPPSRTVKRGETSSCATSVYRYVIVSFATRPGRLLTCVKELLGPPSDCPYQSFPEPELVHLFLFDEHPILELLHHRCGRSVSEGWSVIRFPRVPPNVSQ